MLIAVKLADGKTVEFDIDTAASGRCFFVLGIRKCGSTMLNKICRALARWNGLNWVDVAGTFFQNNVNFGGWKKNRSVADILHAGNVYGGFRNLPPCFHDSPTFEHGTKLLLVRDPRDALVSEYFSNAYSHVLPVADENAGARKNLQTQREKALSSTIDEYVLARTRLMAATFMDYGRIWMARDVLKLKYEDVIFDKHRLVTDIAHHFDWSVTAPQIAKIVALVDVRPATEQPSAFIRKVTPGDHREKLQAETIEALNRLLAPPLRFFGYA